MEKKLNAGQKALKKDHPEVAAKIGFKKGGKAKRCLLYTSPSPRDRTRSRMPSSA